MPARSSRAEVMDREARALELRRNGASYPQIAERLGISDTGARKIVKRVLTRYAAEAAPEVRKLELERLDQYQVAVLAVLRREHHVVQGGKIVLDSQGQAVRDDGPTMAAVRTLLDIQQRRARLLGLDAPTKVEAKVFTMDAMQARLEELNAELAGLDGQPQPTGRED
jgi:transposase